MKVEIHQQKYEKTIQKHITKNDAKMKRPKAIHSEGPGGTNGPSVPEEVRSSSGDSRSRFPLASNIVKIVEKNKHPANN